jgi:hypothetical protein
VKKAICILFVIFLTSSCYSQGINNLWLLGYDNPSGPPWGSPYGGTVINFSSGTADTSSELRNINFSSSIANISDGNGILQFYTNGISIGNAQHDTMQNGSGINPGWYVNNNALFGSDIPQSCLIIPYPDNDSLYYLFHSTIDTLIGQYPVALRLYYSLINMNQNNGLGAVISKNNIIISDTLNPGKITACKHANGRDFWLICHKGFSKIFYKLLITPYGVYGPYTQQIGMFRQPDGGQVCFSPDGSRFAYYNSYEGDQGAQLFNFNRCTGMLSHPYYLSIQDSSYGSNGVAFSPNSELLYISALWKVYQFDCTAPDINATKYLVAEWDSFYSPPGFPFATTFNNAQLAPDGKIYISSSNSSLFLHVINQPNNLGVVCDMVQHGCQLPTYNGFGIPNHPNYFLGKIPGSPCDTITGVGIEENHTKGFNLSPNPNDGMFAVSYTPQIEAGAIEIYDLLGSLVLKDLIAQWSQFKNVDVSHIPNGIYLCRLSWGYKTASMKFIKGD